MWNKYFCPFSPLFLHSPIMHSHTSLPAIFMPPTSFSALIFSPFSPNSTPSPHANKLYLASPPLLPPQHLFLLPHHPFSRGHSSDLFICHMSFLHSDSLMPSRVRSVHYFSTPFLALDMFWQTPFSSLTRVFIPITCSHRPDAEVESNFEVSVLI